MKWDRMRRSSNVEDVRGSSRRGAKTAGVSILGFIIALLASIFFGVNPADVLSIIEGSPTVNQPQTQVVRTDDRDSNFVRAVLGDTEDVWSRIFPEKLGSNYQQPKLVLFDGAVNSACGFAEAAAGPFYCPRDQKVYLDMSFFRQVKAAAGPNADFARAYAIAHEIGHHIQNQLGTATKVRRLQSQSDQRTANQLSTRLELQADCYAGVWGHYTAQRGLIGAGDIQDAVDTAAQIGDDYLQKQAKGYVVPDAFTHGSSQQRVNWFTRGIKTGNVQACNTFST